MLKMEDEYKVQKQIVQHFGLVLEQTRCYSREVDFRRNLFGQINMDQKVSLN